MKLKTLFCTAVLAAVMQISAQADTFDGIYVSETPSVGDTFTVTVRIDSDSYIGSLNSSLEYDDDIIEFIGGDAVGGGGIITVQTFPDDKTTTLLCDLTFKAINEGTCSLSLSNGYVFSADGIVLCETSAATSIDIAGNTETQTATDDSEVQPSASQKDSSNDDNRESSSQEVLPPAETESESPETDPNAENLTQPVVQGYLIDLKCSAGALSPGFSYDIFDYTVYADASAEKAELSATAAAFSDVVTISGDEDLKVGSNIFTVKVSAEDGTENLYTVNVIREKNNGSSKKADIGSSDIDNNKHDKLKDMLNPALAIILIVLVVSLFIVINWTLSLGKKKKNGE